MADSKDGKRDREARRAERRARKNVTTDRNLDAAVDVAVAKHFAPPAPGVRMLDAQSEEGQALRARADKHVYAPLKSEPNLWQWRTDDGMQYVGDATSGVIEARAADLTSYSVPMNSLVARAELALVRESSRPELKAQFGEADLTQLRSGGKAVWTRAGKRYTLDWPTQTLLVEPADK